MGSLSKAGPGSDPIAMDRPEGHPVGLARRIKHLLPHHGGGEALKPDFTLQRSRSFLDVGRPPWKRASQGGDGPSLPRRMSRSESLRNVAMNISMRIRGKKPPAKGLGGGGGEGVGRREGGEGGEGERVGAEPDSSCPQHQVSTQEATHRAQAEVSDTADEDPHPYAGEPHPEAVNRHLLRSSSLSSLLHRKRTNHRTPSFNSFDADEHRNAYAGATDSSAADDELPEDKAEDDGSGRWRHGGSSDKFPPVDQSAAAGGPQRGGSSAFVGKFKRNRDQPPRRCCRCHRNVSREKLVRLLVQGGQVQCPWCKGRPLSLDVSKLAEEEEEAGAAEDASQGQGRSRSLTHIDSLDPTMLVKAAAAAAAVATKGPADPDDPTVPLIEEDGAVGLMGPSKRLSGSAELPAPGDRLIVPGGPARPLQDSKMRRQKLTRSQVSSSEYFSVSFECLDDPGPEEFVPACKGMTLAEALGSVCAKRAVELSSVSVYQEGSKKPLSIYSTDSSRLGGRHLRVRAKEDRSPSRSFKGTSSSQGHSRKTSGSYKGYKGGKFFSASTEDPSYASSEGLSEGRGQGPPSKAPSRQRWSAIFGNNKDTRMETLAETLDSYSKNGIPKLPLGQAKVFQTADDLQGPSENGPAWEQNLLNHEDTDDEESLLFLEDDWREVIGGDGCAVQLTEKETQQQEAIWELLTTEAAYIRTLKVVTDLFLACLLSLQSSASILTEVDTECLFSNIREIHAANISFWRRHLLPMVRDAQQQAVSALQGQPCNGGCPQPPCLIDPKHMKEGFLKFGQIFHPYIKYCGDQSRCQQYCREKIHENELFTAYLAWCETRKECNRLRLLDIVVKPMQRLTKYSLLLKAIQKHTENAEDIESLDEMIKAVDEFVNGVNTTLRQRQEQERLRGIIARIESYDVVETKDDEIEKMVKTYSELDLTCPMPGCNPNQRRHLILESDARLRDHATSKTDVHVLLFTDMLLVCKAVTKKGGSAGGAGGGGLGGGGAPSGSSGALGAAGGGSSSGVPSHGGSLGGGSSVDRSGSDRMLKVIRQAFVVDRLVVKEATSGNALSFVYLNEFNLATAAFSLSSESKSIKSLNDALSRAREQYARAKRKARSEEAEEAVNAALAASAAPPSPRHAPKLAALSPFDSAGSSSCLCLYEDFGANTLAAAQGVGLGDAGPGLVPSCPRSPRCGSSRGSRLSSLAHSHSGSMEMYEASSGGGSACHSRGVSVETMTDLRGSSLSSDEGSTSAAAAAAAANSGTAAHSDSGASLSSAGRPSAPSPAAPPSHQPPPPTTSASSPSLHQIPPPPTSPRPERRAVLSRSPTPNTLSVLTPYAAAQSPSTSGPAGVLGVPQQQPMRVHPGGQSLPNLCSVAGATARGGSQHQQSAFLLAPPPSRSPPPPPPIGVNQRGVSYPPPSPPRSLRRSYAVVAAPGSSQVAPSRNHHPPLTKSRHVGSLGPSAQPSFCVGGGVAGEPAGAEGVPDAQGAVQCLLDVGVPIIGGVVPPSNEGSGEDLEPPEDPQGSGSEVTAACPSADLLSQSQEQADRGRPALETPRDAPEAGDADAGGQHLGDVKGRGQSLSWDFGSGDLARRPSLECPAPGPRPTGAPVVLEPPATAPKDTEWATWDVGAGDADDGSSSC